jgi:GNAT superfamily N-acetyltransferase
MGAALEIGPADLKNVPEAIALAQEAASWLTARGETLWGANELKEQGFVDVARNGALILGRIEDVAATCMFLQDSDPIFWPEDPPGEAFYIHRLAVARKFAGQGHAVRMLEWGADQARLKGRRFLRLDCEARPKLMALYASAGFVPVDPMPVCITGHWVVRQQRTL